MDYVCVLQSDLGYNGGIWKSLKRLHTVKEQVCVVEIESFVNGGADEE